MERDKRPLKEADDSEEEKTNPRTIQEYEFFVQGRAGETEPPIGEKAEEREGTKEVRDKNRVFFASGEETDG